MRLRYGIAVVVSVVLLLMTTGVAGVLVNRSGLQAADTVHRADSMALGHNNATLVEQLQLLSAKELNDFAESAGLTLRRADAKDRAALSVFAGKSPFFAYGLTITDLKGNVLNATRSAGLPAVTDPGFQTLHAGLRARGPGFSSVMMVGGVALTAVAVPVRSSAILIGFNRVAATQLQDYVQRLTDAAHLTAIADADGRVAAASDPALIGTTIDATLIGVAHEARRSEFVEYARPDGTSMIAVVVPDLPGGWTYTRLQTRASFDGAVHKSSEALDLTLLAMLVVGVLGISILGYRTIVTRRRADQRFQALFQHAPDLVAVVDGEGTIAYSSPSAPAVLGVVPGSLQGSSVFDVVHPDDRESVRAQFAELTGDRNGVLRRQCRVLNADGNPRWFEFTASNQLHNPALAGIVINARDVSQNRAFQERLAHEARHDALTGLPNRRRMQDALDETLRAGAVAVLFVDLDGFKPVNDKLGHEAGDELLRQVAERLSGCVREEDVLARVGGDEFVILMPGVRDNTDAEAMARRVRAEANRPFRLHGDRVEISASVGIHLARPESDPDEALRAADHAMYAMKHAGAATVAETVPVGRHRAEP